jgi:hypothetical protein
MSFTLVMFLLFGASLPLAGRGKDKAAYGEGLIVNLPFPVSAVEQVVEDITENGLIRGTKEYNKDEFVTGAKAASSSNVFPGWNQGGKVFYKVREQALDPRNFKDSGDVGTLVVRYVVQAQGDKNTVLRIDALFQEQFRKTVHPSNGSVESNEYKDIHDHLEAIEAMKNQTIEAEKERQEQLEKRQNPAGRASGAGSLAEPAVESSSQTSPRVIDSPPSAATQEAASQAQLQVRPQEQLLAQVQPQVESDPSQIQPAAVQPAQSLEEHVKDLRKQVERLVKAPGAPLKSAPFHTASTLQSLNPGTELIILISTPYWYGVETHEGQHGWVLRDQLEQP